MLPILIVEVLNFVLVHNLDCYVTQYQNLTTFNITSEPTITDCRLQMEARMREKGIKLGWYYWENNVRCYTIGVKAKFQGRIDDEDMDIRLCDFKDRCEIFSEKIKLEMLESSIVGIIKCGECLGNLCNSKITHDNLVKVKSNVSSYRRNLYIGAGGCGVVGFIGALTRCLFCKKAKNIVKVNV